MRLTYPTFTAILMTLGAAGAAQAGEWTNTLTPYMWAAGLDGTAAIGPVEADVDVGFGDIWDNLDVGGMVSYRGEGDGPWIVMVDAIYMDLEVDKTHSEGPVRVDAEAEIQQTVLEGDVGYRLTDKLIAYAGLRYSDLNLDLSVNRTGPGSGESRSAGGSESWVDPVIGAVMDIPLAEKWTLALRGDIGGFGVGSDFAWQAMATVRWQATPSINVVGGYRHMAADYDNGDGANYFKYDMASTGPLLGIAFTF